MGILGAAVVAVICLVLVGLRTAPDHGHGNRNVMERVRVLERRIATPTGLGTALADAGHRNLHCTPMPHGMEDYNPHKCGCKWSHGLRLRVAAPKAAIHTPKITARVRHRTEVRPKGTGRQNAAMSPRPPASGKLPGRPTTSAPSQKMQPVPRVCEACYDKTPQDRRLVRLRCHHLEQTRSPDGHGTNRDPRWPVLEARDSGERIHS